MMCGVLNTDKSLDKEFRYEYDETFFVYSNFGVHLKFLEFKLPSSELCSKAEVKVLSRFQKLIYCGRRVPWTVALTE